MARRRRPLLQLVCALALAAGALGCGGEPSGGTAAGCPRCNLVLVSFDALRADHLGSIDASARALRTTPHLDRFARDATVFTRALSQSGSTVTSLPSLFTSRYTFVDGIHDEMGLAPGQRTLVHDLRDAGYTTAAVIGWRFAGTPAGVQEGFQIFDEEMEDDESAARSVERALARLPELAEPFFLWLHLRPPHQPYRIAEETFRTFYDGPEDEPSVRDAALDALREHFRTRERVRPYHYFGQRRPEGLTPSILRQLRASYAASLNEADAAFGAFLDALDARFPNSVVSVAADHGEALGEHAFLGHNHLYYEVLHTPLVVRVPGRPGARVDRPAMNVDLMPTLLALVGVPVAGAVRGRDLFGALPEARAQFAGYENMRTLVQGDDQVIVRPRGTDHFELTQGARTKGPLSDAVLRLADQARNMAPLEPGRAAPLQEESETFEALRSLGYIE